MYDASRGFLSVCLKSVNSNCLCSLFDLCIDFFVNKLYVYNAADKSSECVIDQIADLKCATAGDELHYLNAQRKYKR